LIIQSISYSISTRWIELTSENFAKKNWVNHFFITLSSAGLSAGQRFQCKTACYNKMCNFCCGPFENNLKSSNWRRNFKIIFNVKKIGKKLFKVAVNLEFLVQDIVILRWCRIHTCFWAVKMLLSELQHRNLIVNFVYATQIKPRIRLLSTLNY
jgi:hypothetical protein